MRAIDDSLKNNDHLNQRNLSNLGIQGKLLLGFSAITVILISSIITILIYTNRTQHFIGQVTNYDLPIYHYLIDISDGINNNQLALLSSALSQNSSLNNDIANVWDVILQTQVAIENQIVDLPNYPIKNQWQEIKSLLTELKTSQLDVVNLTQNKQIAEANNKLINSTIPIFNKVSKIFNVNQISNSNESTFGILDKQDIILRNDATKLINDLSNMKFIEYLILSIGIISCLLISFITAKKILQPLNDAINIAKKIANGERNISIVAKSNDETGQLLNALSDMQAAIIISENKLQQNEAQTRALFDSVVKSAKLFSAHSSKVSAGDLRERLNISVSDNDQDVMVTLGGDLNKMTDNLAMIAQEITHASHNMVSTLEEVRHAVDVQSSGASEQAASINEITASVSEIEKSTEQTMEKAKTLGAAAEKTREKGQMGLEAVEQSVSGMKAVREKVQLIAQTILDLSNQTQQVGEITAVVNNLAQQSKMLALNASIEAVKAGEAGKGFAVVAVEVKNLAEQSEQSTTQVQKILEDIRRAAEKAVMVTEEGTKGVDLGMSLVDQTGEIIRSLNDVIHETTIASQQIEAAVRQESAGIEQITAGMNEINQVTTSFVESVKQTTEAMSNLIEITKSLKAHVDIYKI